MEVYLFIEYEVYVLWLINYSFRVYQYFYILFNYYINEFLEYISSKYQFQCIY